jgi:hypothetical protein
MDHESERGVSLHKCCKYGDMGRDEMRFGQRKCIGFKRRGKRDMRDRGDIAYTIVRELFCIASV